MGLFKRKPAVEEFNPYLQDCPIHGETSFTPYLADGFSCVECLKEGVIARWREREERENKANLKDKAKAKAKKPSSKKSSPRK